MCMLDNGFIYEIFYIIIFFNYRIWGFWEIFLMVDCVNWLLVFIYLNLVEN